MNGLKILATCCALLVTTPLPLTAGEHIFSKSPDGKFALRTTFTDFVPSHGDAAIIETGTSKVAVQLHSDEAADSEKLVDKVNGYMSCPGDGAQPEFELALFRYRDGRALLALCNGELEGADSVQLQFFELGADGKMHQISRPILPGTQIKNDPGKGYVKEGWQFELPRTGKTIRVRAQKGGKILHKFTWDGEEFVEQK